MEFAVQSEPWQQDFMRVFYLQESLNKTAANVCTHVDPENDIKETLNRIGF